MFKSLYITRSLLKFLILSISLFTSNAFKFLKGSANIPDDYEAYSNAEGEVLAFNDTIIEVGGYKAHEGYTKYGTHEAVENITASIINGENAFVNQYPYFAGLFIMYSSSQYAFFCGGTLIKREWILTAAHCVQSNYDYRVIIGLYTTANLNNAGQKKVVQIVRRNNIFIHPKFDPNTLEYDFALFKISYVDSIQPAEMDKGQYINHNVYEITGFGSTGANGNGPTPTVLQKGTVSPISSASCGSQWGFAIEDAQMCASGLGYRDVCKGDSGGPLIVNNVIVGVVSYGYMPCNMANGPPVVYGKVISARPWIKSMMSSNR